MVFDLTKDQWMELRAQFARLSGGVTDKVNCRVCSLGSMEHKAQSESDDLWISMRDDLTFHDQNESEGLTITLHQTILSSFMIILAA